MFTAKTAILWVQTAILERFDDVMLEDIELVEDKFHLHAVLPKGKAFWDFTIKLPANEYGLVKLVVDYFGQRGQADLRNLQQMANSGDFVGWFRRMCISLLDEVERRYATAAVGDKVYFVASETFRLAVLKDREQGYLTTGPYEL